MGNNLRSLGKGGQNIWRGKVAGVVKEVSGKDKMKILHFFWPVLYFFRNSALIRAHWHESTLSTPWVSSLCVAV